jgi:anti-sigma regulatory factor (Ser/Thr protein kinase)
MWIGTYDIGLYRYDEAVKSFQLYRHDPKNSNSIGAYMIRALTLANGYLWVGTDPGGLSRFDYNAPASAAFQNLNTEQGLPSNQVCALLTDRSGHIWAGTTKGLAWINSSSLQARSWTRRNGLRQDYIDLPLGLGSDGSILMGEADGYTFFQPDSLLLSHYDGRIWVESFQAGDTTLPLPLKMPLIINWRDNFLRVTFASAELSEPEKNEFLVQLVGFDPQPRHLRQPESLWTNVPPGQYKLRIQLIREGTTIGEGYWLSVQIAPPFWQTWPFRIGVVLTLLGLLWGIYWYRVGQIRRTERMKSEFEQRLAQVEMSALRAQMNPHFVFNSLNAINRFILMNDSDAASAYLTKFSRLIRLILDHSRCEMIGLDQELNALRLYIELEALRFNEQFAYNIEVDEQLPLAQMELPPMLIQPYLENAIWHGLMQKRTKGHLWLRVSGTAQSWQIEVEDDGIGRAQAAQFRSKTAQTHKSYGMQLNAERLRMIRQVYQLSATLDIVDKTDAEGQPQGTIVRLHFERNS